MDSVALLKGQSELAFQEIVEACAGLSEGKSWAAPPQTGSDYLHTDGSILGVVLHVASAKFIYGSCAFRDNEIRWRDCADRIDRFEPSWTGALDYLHESHRYWLETWGDLLSSDLEAERPNFRGQLLPSWKIIRVMIHHDSYHAGQIAVLRYALVETDKPPISYAADIREFCRDLPSW